MKAGGHSNNLTVETIESVVSLGFAGIAVIRPTADPLHMRAAARPFDEWFDAGRQ